MPPQFPRPTLVVVPGSFSPPHFYSRFSDALTKHGFENIVVTTPSVGRRAEGPATMSDDAEAIASVLRGLVDQGKSVVILAHSYGGIPATQSLKGGKLGFQARRAAGLQGGVALLMYMSALVLKVGVSSVGFMGQLPDFLNMEDDYIKHDPIPNGKLTFSDLSEEEAVRWARQMPEHSTPSFTEELSYPGYRDVNVTYVLLEDDMIIPPANQEAMIQFLREEEGKNIDVYRFKSGHCPNASKPEELAALIADITVQVNWVSVEV